LIDQTSLGLRSLVKQFRGRGAVVFDAAVNGGNPQRWHDMYAGLPALEFIEKFQAEHVLYLPTHGV